MQRCSLFFFGLASFFLLTHYLLNKAEVGIFALFQTIISLVEYLKMGLLRNALIKLRYDKTFSNRPGDVYLASFFINTIFSLVVVGILYFGAEPIAQLLKTSELKILLRASCLLVVLQIPFNHCEIIQQSQFNYKASFYAYLFRQGIFFFFILVGLIWKASIVTNLNLVFAQGFALAVASVYFFVITMPVMGQRTRLDFIFVGKLLSFGRYVFGTALLSYLYKFADHFVTASLIGNPVAGKIYVSYYNVVSRVTNVLDVPFMAVADVLFPKNAQAVMEEGPAKVKYYFERMVGMLTALILPVSLLILLMPGLVIRVIAGPAYLPAVPILQLTMMFAFLRPFYGQFGFTLDSIGKPNINFWVNAGCLVISLASTVFCIYNFGGLMGAAYANVVTLIAGTVIFYLVLRKELGIELTAIFRYGVGTYVQVFTLLKSKLL